MMRIQPFNVRAHLIPFATRVLYRGAQERHQPQEWPVPVGDRELYTEEDMEAWRVILPQGVLYAFCHQAAGWRPRELLVGREAWSAEARRLRLWDAAAGLSMTFGEGSLRLCEGLYNGVARKPREAEKRKKHAAHDDAAEIKRLIAIDLSGVGDMALSYWAACALWSQIGAAGVQTAASASPRTSWPGLLAHMAAANPMLGLRHGPWTEQPVPDDAALDALIASPARALLPWWIGHALDYWQSREAALWGETPEAFVAARLNQRAQLRAWVQAINRSGWVHLLEPIRESFVVQERWLGALAQHTNVATVSSDAWRRVHPDRIPAPAALAEAGRKRVEAAYKRLRHEERESVRRSWADALECALLLSEAYRERVRVHHADREANDVFMVDWGARTRVDAMAERLSAAARGIEGRLG